MQSKSRYDLANTWRDELVTIAGTCSKRSDTYEESAKKLAKFYNDIRTLFDYHKYLYILLGAEDWKVSNNEPIMLMTILRASISWKKPFELILKDDFINPKKSWQTPKMFCSSQTVKKTYEALLEKGLIYRLYIRADKDSKCDRYVFGLNLGNILLRIHAIIENECGENVDNWSLDYVGQTSISYGLIEAKKMLQKIESNQLLRVVIEFMEDKNEKFAHWKGIYPPEPEADFEESP